MTFAHVSDTHLGYRAYARTTPEGLNQREYDVMKAFQKCLHSIAERDPDVVVHSGDLFHLVRPSNHTIVGAFRAMTQFQEARGGKPFILIGGNHDTPKVSESGNILGLFAGIPGVKICTGLAECVDFPGLDLEVLCVPSMSVRSGEPIAYRPQLSRRYSVLTIHGLAAEALPESPNFVLSDTNSKQWTYVALGDYHSYQRLDENVCYAGSTEFTSPNFWIDKREKGWVWFDADTQKPELVPVETRRVIDLPKIDAKDLTPEDLESALLSQAKWPQEELPIVRQRVMNVHQDLRGRMGAAVIREISATCLSYLLQLLPPEAAHGVAAAHRTESPSLERSWASHIAAVELAGGIERDAVRDLGVSLLKEVEELAADPA